ncbi:MAG: L-aspartate oxidase, partial [Mesorhizobium sp.]
ASRIRPIVSHALGIERDGEALRDAAGALAPIAAAGDAESDPALVALMITIAALRREESRGSHFRSDFPRRDAQSKSLRLTLDEALAAAASLSDTAAPLGRRV